MEYTLLEKVTEELSGKLSGAKVVKIFQPDPELLIFKLRVARENLKLLISAEPQNARIHLTEKEWLNPFQPPRFCQLLRARISRIDGISLFNQDRIVILECQGGRGPCRLVCELFGRHGNLLLLDDAGVIIDLLKRVPAGSGRRDLRPKATYRLPGKGNMDEAAVISVPTAVAEEGDNWSGLVEKELSDRNKQETRQEFHQTLLKIVANGLKKVQRRLTNIRQELGRQERCDLYRLSGELLLSNFNRIEKGMKTVELTDFSKEPPELLAIPLDARRSPQQNAEHYFKLYKKARRGREHSERRLAEGADELNWLQQLKYQLEDSVNKADLEEIAEELSRAGLLREKNPLRERRTTQPSRPHEAITPHGCKIFWGRNNRQNDELSTRVLQADDIWLHAHNVPGAHVIVKQGSGPGNRVPDQDLEFAAGIAAGYSQSRHSGKVEVMIAKGKDVSKRKGARPGQVQVGQYKTLLVEPVRPH